MINAPTGRSGEDVWFVTGVGLPLQDILLYSGIGVFAVLTLKVNWYKFCW